jgi:hypothetical protein
MATATKVRKTKDGSGTIYKLEPALVVEGGEVEYITYYLCVNKETYGGMIAPVKVTIVVASAPSETGYKENKGLFSRRYEGKKLSVDKALGLIGYTIKKGE